MTMVIIDTSTEFIYDVYVDFDKAEKKQHNERKETSHSFLFALTTIILIVYFLIDALNDKKKNETKFNEDHFWTSSGKSSLLKCENLTVAESC